MPSLLEKPFAFLKTKAVSDCKINCNIFYMFDQLKRKFLHQ